MLGEVEEIRDELSQKRVPKLLFIGTLVTGIIATAFAYFLGASRPAPAANEPEIPPPAPAAAVIAPVTPAGLPPAGSRTIHPPPTAPIPRAPVKAVEHAAIAWPVLEGSRWKASRTDREIKVVFDYGTFSRGVELAETARQDLKTIATAIKAKGNQFRIEVEGHTDAAKVGSGRSFGSNNKSLGLARAKAAASYLTKQCGIPSSAISTSSAGEDNPPYPNTTADNQKKNRTVVLKIRPAQP